MIAFTREELWKIRERAEEMAECPNPSWQRAYLALAQAACVLDAFIARSTLPAPTIITEEMVEQYIANKNATLSN